jgi:hypothetical protein
VPTFILAGFQRDLGPRIETALFDGKARLNDWSCIAFAGHQHRLSDIGKKQVGELLDIAGEQDGATIFGVSEQKTRSEIECMIKPHFRFRWIDVRAVKRVGGGDAEPLLAALEAATLEENYWIQNIRPKDSTSPLVLPEIFCAKKDLSTFWRLANSYNNQGHLQAAASQIEKFTRYHRRRTDGFANTPWRDDDSWVWDDNGERHGTPLFPEEWKYSFKLPDGFHFDVSPFEKGKTFFTDKNNQRHSFKRHLNITAHGEVRGVK